MLYDAAKIRKVIIACGTVDLRKGIEGLSLIIGSRYGCNPLIKEHCFCSVEDARPNQRPSVDGRRISASV